MRKQNHKARKVSKSNGATCVERMALANPKNEPSERMAKAAAKLKAALRKPVTFTAARRVAGTGVHGTRALLVRLGARSPERGVYQL